jgi:deazaflavin-dependent oxidoreductase (nitroreductase family)
MPAVPVSRGEPDNSMVHSQGPSSAATYISRGRKSGKEYSVPVAVIPTHTTFIIALPWGRETDWVRNTRAAGRCTARWKGVDYECTDPTFVEKDVALGAARGVTRFALQRRDFPDGFIQLTRRAPR